MKFNVLLLVLLFPIYCVCQLDLGRTYSNSIPASYEIDVAELTQHTFDRFPEKFKSEKSPRTAYKFADMSAVVVRDLLTSGSCYSDWKELEDYVNQILQNVIPAELKDDKMIRAYIVKDGRYNAFMTGTGVMFLHIGMFAEVKDEATIAGVIAHELAHYYKNHSIEGFMKSEKGDFKPGLFLRNKKSYTKFSVANELDADSLATVWLSQSGYHTNGLVQSLENSKKNEDRRLLQYEDLWEFEETTHPDPTKRLGIAHDHSHELEASTGKYFLVDKRTFFKIKEEAKSEILKFLLRDFQYDDCIEKAFKFHLRDVENPTYLYYLMEGIRRKCFLNVKDWNKNFITDNYHKIVEKKGEKTKVKMDDHLFKAFPSEILMMDPKDLIFLSGKFYWEEGGDVKFRTYEEAFMFFGKIAELVGEPECILVNALSVEFDEKKCKPLLEKYLSNENIKFKAYAENLLAKTSKSALKDKKLTVINDFNPYVREGKDYVLVRDYADNNELLHNTFNRLLKDDKKREVIYFPSLKAGKLQQYTLLKELEQFAYLKKTIRGQNPELHVLDPRYWQLMNELGVNEIEFVNIRYTDVRKSNSTLESYQEIAKVGFKEFLDEPKRSRYVHVYVNSVRSIEKSLMKILHYGGQTELNYKYPANVQLGQILNSCLEIKDVRAKEADARFVSGDLDMYEPPKIIIDGKQVN